MQKDLEGNKALSFVTTLIMVAVCLISFIYYRHYFANVPLPAVLFFYLWLILSIIFSIVSLKEFVIGWLVSSFSLLVSARIAALHHIYGLSTPLMIIFGLMLINLIICMWYTLQRPAEYKHPISALGWQLIFIRLYIGFDFIPHFTEKLFAGYATYSADVLDFTKLGVPDPAFFVVLAGLCEFGSAIGIGLGVLLRPATVCATLYLLIATLLGHHFSLGFIWANPGGGWEFVTMWMFLIMTYAVSGYHDFSLDQRVEDRFKVSKFIRKFL